MTSKAPLLVALAVQASFFACGGPPPKKAEEARAPEDPWTAAPKSAEWLYATRDFAGSHAAECKDVAEWIAGEEKCSSTLCAHGAALAKDWLSRCEKLDADDVESVRERMTKLANKARSDSTPCASEAAKWLREGCRTDCSADVQAWATRCGPNEATPLVLRMLERAIERKTGVRASLDPRGCDDLLAKVKDGSSCSQMFQCEDALQDVKAYVARCGREERSLLSAVLEFAIRRGAQQPTTPIPIAAGKVTSHDLGTALDDGSGAALFVCEERVRDLASYVAMRAACPAGKLVFAKAFKRGDEIVARLGELPNAEGDLFALRFPSLRLAGEVELRESKALAPFEAALEMAPPRAPASPTQPLVSDERRASRRGLR